MTLPCGQVAGEPIDKSIWSTTTSETAEEIRSASTSAVAQSKPSTSVSTVRVSGDGVPVPSPYFHHFQSASRCDQLRSPPNRRALVEPARHSPSAHSPTANTPSDSVERPHLRRRCSESLRDIYRPSPCEDSTSRPRPR